MKRKININIDSNKTIELLFDSKFEYQNTINIIRKGVKGSLGYFDCINKIRFGIKLIYSREEFNKMIGYDTENWISAHSFGSHFIIFHPEAMERCTSHKTKEFESIISHETTHILLKKINNSFCAWMNEGVAQNIAKQEQKKYITSKNIDHFIRESLFINSDYNNFIDKQGYQISYKLFKFLMDEFSKETIMKLLKIKYYYVKSAESKVCEVLGIDKAKLVIQIKEVLEGK